MEMPWVISLHRVQRRLLVWRASFLNKRPLFRVIQHSAYIMHANHNLHSSERISYFLGSKLTATYPVLWELVMRHWLARRWCRLRDLLSVRELRGLRGRAVPRRC